VNVGEPISEGWPELLIDNGYTITDVIPAYTRRHGGPIKPKQAEGCEVVIVAVRP
jgi:hypothetical protein